MFWLARTKDENEASEVVSCFSFVSLVAHCSSSAWSDEAMRALSRRESR